MIGISSFYQGMMDSDFSTVWKVSKYGAFYGPHTGKYGPEKSPYLDSFHAMFL